MLIKFRTQFSSAWQRLFWELGFKIRRPRYVSTNYRTTDWCSQLWHLWQICQQEARWAIWWSTYVAFNSNLKALQIRTKKLPKSMKECIENMMRFGLAFGSPLAWFRMELGATLEGKVRPFWLQSFRKKNTYLGQKRTYKSMWRLQWWDEFAYSASLHPQSN